MQATGGTVVSSFGNLGVFVLGLLQSTDWISILPGDWRTGVVLAAATGLNAALHAYTGNTPILGRK